METYVIKDVKNLLNDDLMINDKNEIYIDHKAIMTIATKMENVFEMPE